MKSWYHVQPVMLLSMTAIKCLPPICLFYEINEMPMIVELARLDDVGDIEDTLRKKEPDTLSQELSINVQFMFRTEAGFYNVVDQF